MLRQVRVAPESPWHGIEQKFDLVALVSSRAACIFESIAPLDRCPPRPGTIGPIGEGLFSLSLPHFMRFTGA